jgi:lipopolysaccharide export system permease protein
MLKKLDKYIIKKYLVTFFFAIVIILLITIVFDVSEKIKHFIKSEPPFVEILKYYLTFLPFFASMFSPLFAFISVVYFTSRMAAKSEIVIIFNTGLSYWRFLRPYLFTAMLIAVLNLYLTNSLIPKTNVIKNKFSAKYMELPWYYNTENIHKQNAPNEVIYMEEFNFNVRIGTNFSIEKFNEDGKLEYRTKAERIEHDTIRDLWLMRNYHTRFPQEDGTDLFEEGDSTYIKLNVKAIDFSKREARIEEMDYQQLKKHIEYQKLIGSSNVDKYLIEKNKRISIPFSTIVLTLLAVSLSSRKARGGIGLNIALGIALAFIFIILGQVSSVFALSGGLSPMLAVWLPNIVFFIVALLSIRFAGK